MYGTVGPLTVNIFIGLDYSDIRIKKIKTPLILRNIMFSWSVEYVGMKLPELQPKQNSNTGSRAEDG